MFGLWLSEAAACGKILDDCEVGFSHVVRRRSFGVGFVLSAWKQIGMTASFFASVDLTQRGPVLIRPNCTETILFRLASDRGFTPDYSVHIQYLYIYVSVALREILIDWQFYCASPFSW